MDAVLRISRQKRLIWVCSLAFTSSLAAQNNTGELRVSITDRDGLAVAAKVEIASDSSRYRGVFGAGPDGKVVAKRLPFGQYTVVVSSANFASQRMLARINSGLPQSLAITLELAQLQSSITVEDQTTLINSTETGSVNRVGSEEIDRAPASLPGRSIVDLVSAQPGWLFEGSAVLHPRGSEYVTQFVLDGVPLTDNRSPSFGVAIEGDDVQSMSIYTAGFPAEYGRKLGGVVEINTAKDSRPGIHGTAVGSGGSFSTASGFLQAQLVDGANAVSLSGSGSSTARYLNPPVTQNFTNNGTIDDFSARYERDITENDRASILVRNGAARFEIPDEQVQFAAHQRQDRSNHETLAIASYQHIFSPSLLADFRGMIRDNTQSFWANDLSTPIIPSQDRRFREGYLKAVVSAHHGRNEWKAGIESDATNLHEAFSDLITDPSQFDPGTPPVFQFHGEKWDLEQSAFLQDQVKLGQWNISAGLRWDHYQLLENRQAASPRISVSKYFQKAELVLHASYDRVFQTPPSENILLSSSSQVVSLNANFLRIPVAPSLGNYYEAGFTKGLLSKLRLDGNFFVRRMNNYLDDDQLLNTGVSFPITFSRARLYGAEGKLEIPHWGRASGFVSYSYIVGSVYFPVSGGLFLGAEATGSLAGVGRFWDTQDQRNTVRFHSRVDLTSRVWIGAGADYGSGLPVQFNGTRTDALDQYGAAVVDRVDLNHGRVRPSFAVDASLGLELVKTDKLHMEFQADGENLNNRLNVLDFAGLFSGNAIAPPRSFNLRLKVKF